jgi:hypothetical protein
MFWASAGTATSVPILSIGHRTMIVESPHSHPPAAKPVCIVQAALMRADSRAPRSALTQNQRKAAIPAVNVPLPSATSQPKCFTSTGTRTVENTPPKFPNIFIIPLAAPTCFPATSPAVDQYAPLGGFDEADTESQHRDRNVWIGNLRSVKQAASRKN